MVHGRNSRTRVPLEGSISRIRLLAAVALVRCTAPAAAQLAPPLRISCLHPTLGVTEFRKEEIATTKCRGYQLRLSDHHHPALHVHHANPSGTMRQIASVCAHVALVLVALGCEGGGAPKGDPTRSESSTEQSTPSSEQTPLGRLGVLYNGRTEQWDTIRYAVAGDSALIGDDVYLGTVAEMDAVTKLVLGDTGMVSRKKLLSFAAPGLPYWANDTVPYEITNFGADTMVVLNAMREWERGTPIRFVRRQQQRVYVDIQRASGNTCTTSTSRWVRRGTPAELSKPVRIRAGTGCVGHELGHSIGLYHEHQRPDRDTFVDVHPPRGREDQYNTIFDAVSCGAYDLGSIMHYDPPFVTAVPPNQITRRDNVVSAGDRAGVNHIYAGTACN